MISIINPQVKQDKDTIEYNTNYIKERVIDNNGQYAEVEMLFPIIGDNIVKSVNRAIVSCKGSYICIIEDGTYLSPGWHIPILEVFDTYQNVAAVCFDQVTVEESHKDLDINNTEFLIWKAGEPIVFRAGAFNNVGLLDERFDNLQIAYEDMLIRVTLANGIFGSADNAIAFGVGGDIKKMDSFNSNIALLKSKWGIVAKGPFIVDYQGTSEANRLSIINLNLEQYNKEMSEVNEKGRSIGIVKRPIAGGKEHKIMVELDEDGNTCRELGLL